MKIALFPFCLGALGKNNGTELAPQLLAKSLNLEAQTAEIIQNDIEKTHQNIEKLAVPSLGKNSLFLGGDHSLTYSTFRAFSREFGAAEASLVLFDAHADCTFFTSAKSHEDYLRGLIEENALLPLNVLLIGTRQVWKEERAFLKKRKIRCITARRIRSDLKNAAGEIEEFVSGKKAIYVSIDFDVLDGSIAFATGYPEPNGLNQKQFFSLLETALRGNMRATDFVEFNPLLDRNGKGFAVARHTVRFILERMGK